MLSLLKRKTKETLPGLIKCAYAPKNLFTENHHYFKEEDTYEELDKLITEISKYLPDSYKSGFSRRACIRNGKVVLGNDIGNKIQEPVSYYNFEKWNDENDSHILLDTNILRTLLPISVKAPIADKFIYLGVTDVRFTYSTHKNAVAVLNAFHKEFMFGRHYSNREPLIEMLNKEGEVIHHGREALGKLYGKGKKFEILEIDTGSAFKDSFSS